MEEFEDGLQEFQRFLPSYLSADAKEDLFRELRQWPDNIDSRLYATGSLLEEAIYQGDGLPNVCVSDLPRTEVKATSVMVLSNSCDTALGNKSANTARLIYCPIMKLDVYATAVSASPEYLSNIRKNRITTIFYLPANAKLGGESVAFMDRINNCAMSHLNVAELISNRLFVLSQYGFYLLLFKLSVHLTRMREGVSRV